MDANKTKFQAIFDALDEDSLQFWLAIGQSMVKPKRRRTDLSLLPGGHLRALQDPLDNGVERDLPLFVRNTVTG